jgi:hypothetical protein
MPVEAISWPLNTDLTRRLLRDKRSQHFHLHASADVTYERK